MRKLQSSLVLIKVDPVIQQDDSGVYIQEEWKSLPPTGTVLEIGSAVTFCQPGDKVFFERYSAIDTPFGRDVRACTETAILAVYED